MVNRICDKIRYEYYSRKKNRKTNGKNIKWAIIGTGNMANKFARALSITDGAEIVAIASRSIEKSKGFANKYKVKKAYGSYSSMLEDKELIVDVVYIATPLITHYQIIKHALNNQKNVLCEKPIVQTRNQFDELRLLAKQNNLFLAEGMWMYCLPVFRKTDEWIKEGKIGNIQKLRIDLSKQEYIDYSRPIFDAQKGGGVLSDYGIYPIAFAVYYLGADLKIEYCKSILHTHGFDTDWLLVLSNDKVFANITFSSIYNGDRKAAVIGDKGCIVWKPQFNRTNSVLLFDENGMKIDEYHVDYLADGYEYEIFAVQDSIATKRKECDLLGLDISHEILRITEDLKSISGVKL